MKSSTVYHVDAADFNDLWVAEIRESAPRV
jgi:hypothetical protein